MPEAEEYESPKLSAELEKLDVRPGLHTGVPAYKQFSAEMIRVIKETIMPPEATEADLRLLCELTATYKLDPFTREIWAAKMKGKNGEKGGVTILVGEAGYLAIAARHDGFLGIRSAPIYASDEFEVGAQQDWRLPARKGQPEVVVPSQVLHKSRPTAKDRGELVAAFAEVFHAGRVSELFVAQLGEYLPTSEAKLAYSPWKQQKSRMLVKCAKANGLRGMYQISGLYVGDEESWQPLEGVAGRSQVEGAGEVDYGDDPAVAFRLRQLFELAEELRPGSFMPAKREALLAGARDEGARLALCGELVEFIERAGGEAPPMVEVVDAVEGEGEGEPDEEAETIAEETLVGPEQQVLPD